VLKIVLVFIIVYVTVSFYKFTNKQLNKQKQKIEKFNTDSKDKETKDEPVPNIDNLNMYYNIIGVFKFHINRAPSSDELDRCMEMIQNEDITIPKLHNVLAEHKENYRVVLFPEIEKKVPELPTETEELDIEEEDEDSDKPIKLTNGPTNVKYILNRPTIYNISSNHPFVDMHKSGNTTDTIIKSVKRSVAEMEQAYADDTNYGNEDIVTHDQVEEKEYKNRCTSNGEMESMNGLANLQENRNIDELEFACDRGQTKNPFDVNNFDFDTKHKTVKAIQTSGSLLGTAIADSKKTKIGSIMPNFNYNEQKRG